MATSTLAIVFDDEPVAELDVHEAAGSDGLLAVDGVRAQPAPSKTNDAATTSIPFREAFMRPLLVQPVAAGPASLVLILRSTFAMTLTVTGKP
jgi:hypothetical protein